MARWAKLGTRPSRCASASTLPARPEGTEDTGRRSACGTLAPGQIHAKFTLRGILKLGFDSVGRGASHQDRHKQDHAGNVVGGKCLAAMVCTAALFKRAQARRLESLLDDAKGRRVKFLVVGQHYDSTPRMVNFGALRPRLFQHARYLHFNKGEGKWELLAWEGFEAATPAKGAQARRRGRVHAAGADPLPKGHGGRRGSQTYWVEPRIVQSTTANNIFVAVNQGIPQLSIAPLQELCEHLAVMALQESQNAYRSVGSATNAYRSAGCSAR